MQVDYLIVGQGLCGTMLSWFLHKEGRSFLVIDDGNEHSSSKVAAGIINPVTGRRYAYTWMIDEIMPFAVEVYQEMGRYFNVAFIMQKGIIDFFPSPKCAMHLSAVMPRTIRTCMRIPTKTNSTTISSMILEVERSARPTLYRCKAFFRPGEKDYWNGIRFRKENLI